VVLVGLLLWPIGLLTGDDGGDKGSSQASASETGSKRPAGVVVVLGQGKQRAVQVQASGLVPSTQKFAYQFWLYDSQRRARSLGAQVANRNGVLRAVGILPAGFEKYRSFDLSREPIGGPKAHSGQSVLRGAMPRLRQVQGNQITTLGTAVLSPPG
jgi:hypothetical protein